MVSRVAGIDEHCKELNRCNQRGGRMLSVFDLLDAGTLGIDLAAYLMARISRGASFMVGANPGGAGKTTVMCALLNLVPADVALVPATAESVRRALEQHGDSPVRCYVCHEIGAGHYFAYLWNRALRDYCSLAQRGHMLATNLHADTIDQARYQVCSENHVPSEDFRRFELVLFMSVSGGWFEAKRRIEAVWTSDGTSDHSLAFDLDGGLRRGAVDAADGRYVKRCRRFLEQSYTNGLRSIEQAREAVVRLLDSTGGL